MGTFIDDVRIASRSLLNRPGFAAVAILTLALGIGLNTSMFSVVNAILLRPLPYPDAGRLVRVFGTLPESQESAFAAPYALDLEEQNSAFERMGLFAWWAARLAKPGEPAEPLLALRVSAGFLPTLGVQPALGRMFTAEEDRPGSDVAILMHRTWTRQFDADPTVVGRTVRLDDRPMTIVGVMPEHFAAPLVFGPVDVLRPLALAAWERDNHGNRFLHVIGRLPPGASQAQAASALDVLAARFARADPEHNAQTGLRVMPLQASGMGDVRRSFSWFVLGISGFVLLIACANLANLQLVRSMGRSRELAVRAALGAPWPRLMRSLATESFVLAVVGGAAGLFVAVWSNAWIASRFQMPDSSTLQIAIDVRVLAFTAVAAIVAGMISGTAPAWLAARVRLTDSLKQNARGTTAGRMPNRVRHALVIGELALALMMLSGAGLFVTGIERFVGRSVGWDADRFVLGRISLQGTEYVEDDAEINLFFERLRQRASALPGVEAATVGWSLPMWDYDEARRPIQVEGRTLRSDEAPPVAFFNSVMPGYFDALGMRLLGGRDFSADDDEDAPAAVIINEAMARTFWPGESAVGQRITWPGGTIMAGGDVSIDATGPNWIEIVGVVNDVRFATKLGAPVTRLQVYRPFAQDPLGYAAIAMRANGDPSALVEPLRRVVADLDADLAVRDLSTVSDIVRENVANFRLLVRVLGGFALLGLLLAALGIYGVIAHVVAQRTREIGVRIALGAEVRDVLRLVLGAGIRLAAAGAVIGVVGSLVLARLLRSIVPALPTHGPWPIAVVTTALIAVALFACYLPARRATRVDPMTTLTE